jgi:hypothetical protein
MKNYRLFNRSIFILLLLIVMVHGYGQTGLNFQGVARTNNNIILASQPISLRLSILQGSATGIAEYVETRRVTTNAQGLFTAVIGDTGAISTLGNFTTINWRNTPKFLKIEMDAAAGNNFISIGTTQFQYVAYAQFANSVDAENITGVVPVARGGTGANSLSSFKTTLALNNVNNTSDLSKPISTATQTALDLKLNASDTVKYVKQTYADSALLTKLNFKDTVKFIKQTYADSALLTKLKLSDTASMLSNRIGKDTLNLSARINVKANMSDLTTGLALKLNATDTSKYTKQTYADSALLTKLSITGNASTATSATTATKLATARTINGVAFDGSADITITSTADAGILTGTTLKSTVTGSSLTSVGTLANLTVTNPIVGSVTGNAATATSATTATLAGTATSATKLTTARTINGVAFDGSGDITVEADAGTLSGTTLNSTVTGSSLTSVGTLVNLTVTNPIVGSITGNATTATKLATARKINGVDFDGSQDITINKLKVGDLFGGGIVFFTWDNGKHGLIAAMRDSVINGDKYLWQWSYTSLNTMAKSDGFGAGYKNMLLILARQGQESGTYAAQFCNEFKIVIGTDMNDDLNYTSREDFTISDWYLPSIHELKLLFEFYDGYANYYITGLDGFEVYWSSTEDSGSNAWAHTGSYGPRSYPKTLKAPVRPIRMF